MRRGTVGARLLLRLRRAVVFLNGESGQALSEQTILLWTLLWMAAVGGVLLNKTHPEMINAINAQVRSYYYMLSLPFL